MGSPVGTEQSRRSLGFLPEQPYFYDSLNGVEYLEFVGRLSGMHGREAGQRAKRWLGRVGLGERDRLVLSSYASHKTQHILVGHSPARMHVRRRRSSWLYLNDACIHPKRSWPGQN